MIHKLLGDLYWEGIEEELHLLALKIPLIHVPHTEQDAAGLLKIKSYLEDIALNEFMTGFLYSRSKFLPPPDLYHGHPVESFETKRFVSILIGDLSILQRKMINAISANLMQKRYEENYFYYDSTQIDSINKIKDLEIVWKIFTDSHLF